MVIVMIGVIAMAVTMVIGMVITVTVWNGCEKQICLLDNL
jgi:uncharacterized protein (DUF983 family)